MRKSAVLISTVVSWCVIAAVLVLAGVLKHCVNYSALFIFFSMESGIFVTKYIKLRKKHELIVTILYTAACAVSLVLLVLQLTGVI